MMRARQSAKQIFDEKIKRMNLIQDRLKESPLGSADIAKIVYETKIDRNRLRAIQNYLAELVGLKIIIYDASSGLYSSAETRTLFKSKHDYDIALKHSKRLVQSSIDLEDLNQMGLYFSLDSMAFQDNSDVESHCLEQHIRTGYNDIFSMVERYRERMIALGLASFSGLPKPILSYEFPPSPPKNERLPLHPSARLGLPTEETAKEIERNRKWDNDPKIKEVKDLRDLLAGKLYYLINVVEHGTPLTGMCDLCPHRRIEVG